jgi:hypothetical protein
VRKNLHATWLHGVLESFRNKDWVGRDTAVGQVPKTLRPIFRDRAASRPPRSLSMEK